MFGFGTFFAIAALPPTISSVFPLDNAVSVPLAPTLSITFLDPSVTKSSGDLYLIEEGGGPTTTIPCSALTDTGTSFTIPLALSMDTDYHVNFDLFCFSNAATISGASAWNFSTRNPVTLLSSDPADSAVNVCYTKGLTLNFNQPVYSDRNSKGGTLSVSCDGRTLFNEVCEPGTFQGPGTATLIKDFSYRQSESCKVNITNNCIHNAGNQYWAGGKIEFTTNSTECTGGVCTPIIFDPLDDSIGVRLDTDIAIEMPSPIILYRDAYDMVAAVDIDIYQTVGDVLHDSYKIRQNFLMSGDGNFNLNSYRTKLTINPNLDLPVNTSFYINITGLETRDCPIYNISDNFTWNFTTNVATPIKFIYKIPRNNRVDVNPDAAFEIELDNPAFRGVGDLRVYKTDGEVLTDTINAASTRIYGIGTNLIRIFPLNGMDYMTDYYVIVDEGFLNGGAPTMPSSEIFKDASEERIWYFRTMEMKKIPFFRDWIDSR